MSAVEEHERLGEIVSRGFDAGNFANAYETTDYDKALKRHAMPKVAAELKAAYRAAFTLGFFGSYELAEMGRHVEAYREAYVSDGGKACLSAGYFDAVDPSEWEAVDG